VLVFLVESPHPPRSSTPRCMERILKDLLLGAALRLPLDALKRTSLLRVPAVDCNPTPATAVLLLLGEGAMDIDLALPGEVAALSPPEKPSRTSETGPE